MEKIVKKLDLGDYIDDLSKLFSRHKPIALNGDINLHYKLISELSNYSFKSPLMTIDLDTQLQHLDKKGVLPLSDIFEFIKIINYFKYLKSVGFEGKLFGWMNSIVFPDEIENMCNDFDSNGDIKYGVDADLDSIKENITANKQHIKSSLFEILNNAKLQPFLVDKQVHMVHNEHTLMVRAGYNKIIKAKTIDRSQNGFFYVVPHKIDSLKQKQSDLMNLKNEIIYAVSKKYSEVFRDNLIFLKYINKEFDKFDHYQARVFFAKIDNKNFILPNTNKNLSEKIIDFSHPALKNAKPITIDMSKSAILITGVNAGGKTMLLKSILSAVYLSKYLIPYKANENSVVNNYKNISAILDDPQSVKNDISTFAGRMVEFSKLFELNNAIIGVDEIELGTDSDEAAALFKVIIEKLIDQNVKIIVTTHHKRLASLLSSNHKVDLIAALYDEKNRRPTYQFLQGTIGQSYAFETALRYNIPPNIIEKAKKLYGEDKNNLNDLIHKSTVLELEYKNKINILNDKIKEQDSLNDELKQSQEKLTQKYSNYNLELKTQYDDAINEAKKAIKSNSQSQSHQLLNLANNKLKNIDHKETYDQAKSVKVGDIIKYNSIRGVVTSIKKDKVYFENDNGIKLQASMRSIKIIQSDMKKTANKPNKKQQINVNITKPSKGSIRLDVHSQREQEALQNVDKFLSDCLINGFEEVIVYHGIGKNILSRSLSVFLKSHPRVVKFENIMLSNSGYDAKLIKF